MISFYWQRCKKIMHYFPGYRITFLFLLVLVIASFGVLALPLDPNKIDVAHLAEHPSLTHPFGTDELGRDYLLRVLHGGHISLAVGFIAMLTSTVIGTFIGLVSGYYGGLIDTLFMRLVDVLSSIPWMVLSIVLSVLLRPGITTVIIVISLFAWMNIARLVRGETLSLKEREYVLYAAFIKEEPYKIILKHILPQTIPTIIVAATANLSGAIMTESALSFLGLGIQQPASSWGSLLDNGQSTLQTAPYMAVIPGLFIICTVVAFNSLGNYFQRVFSNEG